MRVPWVVFAFPGASRACTPRAPPVIIGTGGVMAVMYNSRAISSFTSSTYSLDVVELGPDRRCAWTVRGRALL